MTPEEISDLINDELGVRIEPDEIERDPEIMNCAGDRDKIITYGLRILVKSKNKAKKKQRQSFDDPETEFVKTKIRLNRLKFKKERGELVPISDVHDLNMSIARIYRELGERVSGFLKNRHEELCEPCTEMFDDAITSVESLVREFRERKASDA